MQGIKGILFDMDGTLVDFQATWFAIGDHMAMQAARSDRKRADALLSAAGYNFDAYCFKANSVFATGTNVDIVELWYPQASTDELVAMVKHFDQVTADEGAAKAVALPGSKDALVSLHSAGFRLGVATNNSTGGSEKTLISLGIAQMFDATYGYDAIANHKPAPDTIYAFSDLTGLKSSEIAMVGDNRNDLEMAKAGGALGIAVLSGTGTLESLTPMADVVLDSIVNLPAFLRP